MTVDIMTIGDHIIEYPDVATQTFVSTDEYLNITKKLVRSIAPVYRPGLAEQILKSEDALSNIATQIMMADWRWNGNGSIHGYRKQCAQWAITAFIERDMNRAKNKVVSLNAVQTNFDNGAEFGDTIPGKDTDPAEDIAETEIRNMKSDLIERVLNSGVLTHTQEKCIRMHYLKSMTMQDIGQQLGVTRQAIQDNIKRGINKLKSVLNNE